MLRDGGYDTLGRLTSVRATDRLGSTIDELTRYVFNQAGELDWEVGPNGVTRDNQYDGLGRLTRIVQFADENGDGTRQDTETLVAQFDYEYDAAGNRLSSTELLDGVVQSFTYEYDGLNRLVREELASPTDPDRDYVTTYQFDLASNRTNLTRDDGADGTVDETIDYVYDANDRLLSETSDVEGTTTYEYDRTQQIERVTGDGTVTTQTYDVRGRLATVTIDATASGGDVTVESYTYGLDGIRTSRTVNGETTVFLYDLQNATGFAQILEQGVDANGDGRLQAEEVDTAFTIGLDVITQATVGQVLHLLYDVHGSTRALTDVNGQIANVDGTSQGFTYDAYGQAIGFSAAQAATSLLFSGEFTNANTGNQYLRARFYNPSTGTFNRLDPFFGNLSDPLSFNKYQYTHGNAISGIDPSGLALTSVEQLGVTSLQAGLIAGLVLVSAIPAQTRIDAVTLAIDTIQFLYTATSEIALSGIDRAGEAINGIIQQIGGIVSDLASYADRIADAAAAAIAAGVTTASATLARNSIPYIVPELLTPTIFSNTVSYLATTPAFTVLNYRGPLNPATPVARRAALRGLPPAGPGLSLDEFPFASTVEGGAGSFVDAVPRRENSVQGGLLRAFYFSRGFTPGPFLVLPLAAP